MENCAGYNLRRTSRVVTQLFDAAFAPTGLRSTQISILQMITVKNSPSVRQLAHEMAMDSSTLTRNLQPLVREGYVELLNANRGRAKLARLTHKGRAKLDQAVSIWQHAQSQFLKRFGAKRWRQLWSELRAVAAVLHQGGGSST